MSTRKNQHGTHQNTTRNAAIDALGKLGWLWARLRSARLGAQQLGGRQSVRLVRLANHASPIQFESLEFRALLSSTAPTFQPADFHSLVSSSRPLTPSVVSTDSVFISTPTPAITRGQNASFDVTIIGNPTTPVPQGSVFFTDNGNQFSVFPVAPSTDSSTASATLSAPAVGTHTILAFYGGDANFPASSAFLTLTVAQATPSLNLNINPNPANNGNSISLTATINSSDTVDQATGTVTFLDSGTTTLGVASLVAGTAVLNTSSLSVGTHDISFAYSGDANILSGTAAPQQLVINDPDATATTLSIDSNPANDGQTINITATVSDTDQLLNPTGTLVFMDGSTTLASSNLAPGFFGDDATAIFSANNLSVGTHAISVAFIGNANFAPSSSTPIDLVINRAGTMIPTTISLEVSPTPVIANQFIQMAGSVALAAGTGTPTGSVTIFDGATQVANIPLTQYPPGTFSYFAYQGFSVGAHDLTAVYSGDANYGASTSPIAALNALPPDSKIATAASLTSVGATTTFGQSATFVASVVIPGGAGGPTGTVTFMNGAAVLGSAPLQSFYSHPIISGTGVPLYGIARFTTAMLLPGTLDITVSYSGDATYSPSTSTAIIQVVTPGPASTSIVTLNLFPTEVADGQTVELNASVITQPGIAPRGNIAFVEGTTTLGVVPIDDAGHALFASNTLSTGTHYVTAYYSGDINFDGGSSDTIAVVVGKASTDVFLNINGPNTVFFGQDAGLSASLMVFTTTSSQVPTGVLTFLDGATTLGTAVPSFGLVQFHISTLAVGTHSLTVTYAGDSGTLPSSSSPLTLIVNPVGAIDTATTLAVSSLNINAGDPVTLTTTVASATGTPTGTVDFLADGVAFASIMIDPSGQATYTASSTTIPGLGTHIITAVYVGDSDYASSASSPQTATITANTAITTSLQITSASVGETINISANVSSNYFAPLAGSVTFFDGTTSIGTATPNSTGEAILSISSLSAGTHDLSATFDGQSGFNSSTSSPVSLTISDIGSTTSIITFDISPNPATADQTVTLTATVTGASGTPTGTVTFYKDAQSSSQVALINGVASFTVPQLEIGNYDVFAVYNGDPTYAAASATPINVTIDKAPSSTTLSSSPGPAHLFDNVTFFATITGSGNAPSGTITFLDGTTTLGTATLQLGNVASFTTSSLDIATHSISAIYSGDSFFATSTSAPLSLDVTRARTSTFLSPISVPILFGQTTTLSVQIYTTIGTPTGTITFTDGSITLGTSTLDASGIATFDAAGLSVGTHAISALYAGDASYHSSTSATGTLVVDPLLAFVDLTASTNPATVGSTVTFTASVANLISSSFANPTGIVTFLDGTTTLGTATLDGTGIATFDISSLSAASHSISASYSGDAAFAPAVSLNLTLSVFTPIDTTTLLSFNPATPSALDLITFTATVSSASGTPTGSVTFLDGTTTLGSGALDGSGVATFVTSSLLPGTHSIATNYLPTGDFVTSSSTPSDVIVTRSSTTATLSVSLDPANWGQTTTFTTTVSSTNGTPTGVVSFLDGTTTLGTATLDGTGIATFSTSALDIGTHAISAVYAGDINDAASTSNIATQTVQMITADVSLTVSFPPGVHPPTALFSATVTSLSGPAGLPTGTVEFFEGNSLIGTGTVDATGVATLDTSSLIPGTHTITTNYYGDAHFTIGSSAPLDVTIDPYATTTNLSLDVNPATFGQTVFITATVTADLGTPTGSVTFLDGTGTLGLGSLDASGVATFVVSNFSAGTYNLSATYAGDTNDITSTSSTTTFIINQASTSVIVTSSANPASSSDSITFTAAVGSAVGIPTGSVQFFSGATYLGPGSVDPSGIAEFSTSSLPMGTYTITAIYQGDSNFAGSSSPDLIQQVGFTSTTLLTDNGPTTFGQTATLTATVSGVGPTATGTVIFLDASDLSTIGTATLASGTASFSTSNLAVGAHAITAQYTGDSDYSGSSSTSTLTVNQAATTSAVTADSAGISFGESVTFTASVNSSVGTPTGIVTFLDGTSTLGTATLSAGNATFTTSSLTIASHTITVDYAGDTNYLGSSAAPLSYVVSLVAPTTTLTASPNPITSGQTVTFTSTVSSPGGTPTGIITFTENSITLGTGTIVAGVATLSLSNLQAGTHVIAAQYSGDATFTTSSSSTSLNIDKATPTATLDIPTNPVGFGGSLDFNVTVSGPAGFLPPSGIVTFLDGGTTLSTASLVNGVASWVTSGLSLTIGVHSITIIYAGDANFNGAASPPVALRINRNTTSTTLSVSPVTSDVGQITTFSATVTSSFGTPAGSVDFLDGTVTLGSQPLTGGIANFATSGLAAGTHIITAVYTSDPQNDGSTSTAINYTITPSIIATTTTLSITPQSAINGTTVTFTTTVTSASDTPSGTVNFTSNGVILGNGTLLNGVATFSSSTLALGRATVTAVYTPAPGTSFVASTSTDQDLLVGTAHQRYVAQLYLDLLGRSVDDFGLAGWTAQLDSGTTYQQVAAAITSSREYDGIVVDNLYVAYLNRHVDALGLQVWVDQMQSGLNAEVIRASILGSQEYYDTVGGTDTTFITALYQSFLNRTPEQSGLDGWLMVLNGDPANRQTVASGISNSDENRTAIVTSLYAQFMHRAPDQGGLDFWKSQLAGGISQPQIISAFVTSPEYFSRYEIV